MGARYLYLAPPRSALSVAASLCPSATSPASGMYLLRYSVGDSNAMTAHSPMSAHAMWATCACGVKLFWTEAIVADFNFARSLARAGRGPQSPAKHAGYILQHSQARIPKVLQHTQASENSPAHRRARRPRRCWR